MSETVHNAKMLLSATVRKKAELRNHILGKSQAERGLAWLCFVCSVFVLAFQMKDSVSYVILVLFAFVFPYQIDTTSLLI